MRSGFAGALSCCALFAANVANPAIAGGETRTLSFHNPHTDESGAFTYLVNGTYDPAVLEKLDWFMRDWRINESVKMDPKLFDILWQLYQDSGSAAPIEVLSAYRSPQTNAMLRMRSRLVAEKSQHMQGRAIDAHFQDLGVGKVRDVAMRMQAGGVGFYPIGSTPWVHVDSGSIRYWPRMSRDSLARIFPDGKTVFIPADGQPMAGFEQARAEIEARGGGFQTAGGSGGFNLFTWLFSNHAATGGADDAEEGGANAATIAKGKVMAVAKADKAAEKAAAAQAALDQAATAAKSAPVAVAAFEPAVKSDAAAVDVDPPAPMPPRRPADLALALAVREAPLPHSRPSDLQLAFVSPTDAGGDGGHQDLIRALLAQNQLPAAITRGIALPPKRVMALAEIAPSGSADEESVAKLAKAAALSVPIPKPRKPVALDTAATASIAPPSKTRAYGIMAAVTPPPPGVNLGAFGGFPVNSAPTANTKAEDDLSAALRGSGGL